MAAAAVILLACTAWLLLKQRPRRAPRHG